MDRRHIAGESVPEDDVTRDPDTVSTRLAPGATADPRGAAGPARAAQEPATIAKGQVIRDRYRLDVLLGAGAMGQVWKAQDLLLLEARDPRPDVAIKLLSRDMQRHRDAYVALQREAGKARSLAHPNVATVFNFDVDPGSGLAFIAMELMDGVALDRMIREAAGPLPRERALGLIRGLAAGLAYAHARGIVHCDFKPGNAFATSEGIAKIMDFGIARLARESERARDEFDAGRLAALTPRYATVEMLRGGEPDPADDVYALGLVAYELLSGRHPFDGRAAEEAAARSLRPAPLKDIGRRRWRAIERALILDRRRRWPNAQSFLDAFEGVATWVPALATVAAVLAIAAGYATWVGYSQSQPDVPFAELPEEVQAQFRRSMELGDYAYRAGTQALVGPEALALLYDSISQYCEAYVLHPKNPEAAQALGRALDAFGGRLADADVEVRAEARESLQGLLDRQPALAQHTPLAEFIDELK